MKKMAYVACAAILFLCLPVAQAGFVHGSFDLGFTPPGPPPWAGSGGPPPFVFEIVPDNSALANLVIDEDYAGEGPLSLRLSGETDDDPVLSITKNVLNNTGSTWLGYEIAVNGGSNTFVAGSASSDKMSLISETSNLLTFGLPNPVPSGESVTFMFDILIPSSGNFQFDLSQQSVVPEPSAVILLALGAGVFCCIRRW